MQFRIEVIAVTDDGTEQRQKLVTLTRSAAKLATMGLTLAESKQVLQHLQQTMIEQQVDAYLDQERACPHCGKMRRLKQSEPAPFRTLFGLVEVRNPRWWQCRCRPHTTKTLRPLAALLPERTSPELLYLETKWASLAAYGVTTKLLHEVLPMDQKHNAITVRNHTLRAARRKEQMLGDEHALDTAGSADELSRLPLPDGPFSVGLDGGLVRARRGTNDGQSRERTCFCKCAPQCSMKIGKTLSGPGIPSFALCWYQTRSIAKQPDAPDFLVLPFSVQHAMFTALYDDSVGNMSQDKAIELLILTPFVHPRVAVQDGCPRESA
jgi:hypothetical protein